MLFRSYFFSNVNAYTPNEKSIMVIAIIVKLEYTNTIFSFGYNDFINGCPKNPTFPKVPANVTTRN